MPKSAMPPRVLVPEVLPAVIPPSPTVPEFLPAPPPALELPGRLPADLPAEARSVLAAALACPLPGQQASRGELVHEPCPCRWDDAGIWRLR